MRISIARTWQEPFIYQALIRLGRKWGEFFDVNYTGNLGGYCDSEVARDIYCIYILSNRISDGEQSRTHGETGFADGPAAH